MNKLGKRNYELISQSMNTLGFSEPNDGLMYEEEMYVHEIGEIMEFLKWLHKINRPFGKSNYEQRFAEFKSNEKAPKSWFEVHVHFPGVEDTRYPGGNVWLSGDHSHIKRISGNHTDKLQVAARLCSNLDDPDYLKVVEVNGTYEKEYDLKEMKKFVEENNKAINDIRLTGYKTYPNEFY